MNRTYSPELVDEILNSLDVSIKTSKRIENQTT